MGAVELIMIDFNTYERVKLEDVADYSRAKQGHVYPRGASTLQISATRGQIGYLYADSEVHTKEVVIIPQAGINPRYFNIILQKNIDSFMNKYATGINIQEKEVGKFDIELHDQETQNAVVKMMDFIENKEIEVQNEIDALKKLKGTMLGKMMV